MIKNSFSNSLAVFLTVLLIAPSAFLIAPQPAHAQWAVVEVGTNLWTNIKTTFESTITALESTLSAVSTGTTAWAQVLDRFNKDILAPLAFILSTNLMKSLTSGVISFVIGKTNGTGAPQFATNPQATLQKVGDTSALAFFAQFGTSNSPFAGSIRSALTANYLQNTSLAGFWGANQNTLSRYSPNVNSYLAGNWSQGGVGAWFALTTQTQNNPYTFYQASQAQLASVVGSAQVARSQILSWGQGFMSWCGTSDATTQANNAQVTATQGSVANAPQPDASGTFYDSSGNTYLTQADANAANSATSNAVTANDRATGINTSSNGINPGDPCTNKDGTPGMIQTPGSTIKATLDKVLGGTQDKLTAMGDISSQIGSILSSIGTVMQTVNLATTILGGPMGGLATAGSSSGTNPQSRLAQFQNTPGALGVTNTTVYNNAATSPASGSAMSKRLDDYEQAFRDIRAATNAAQASLTDLATTCDSVGNTTQAQTARDAIASEITPVLNRADASAPIIASARALVAKVQCELNAPANTAVYCDPNNPTVVTDITSSYPADLQTLQNMPPSVLDVANTQQQSQAFGIASGASPTQGAPSGSSLFITANPSIVDQMNLISANAQALKSTCTPPSSGGGGTNNPGGGGNS